MLITANRRYWLFHELSRRPAVQRRFRDEARSVLGGRRCAYEDIPRLEYVRRVILECTRLHTLTWLLMRRSREEVHLDGIRFPTDTDVLFQPDRP
ncbi:cytochrome P450 [Streptomyces sp. NPDC001250]|uniref:cytochrome P450 n=1 Tax=unclassified Streptomyces TaxID=2593676 RepID=UPI003323A229